MSIEVYLLSVPLARHRTIVPRPRDTVLTGAGSRVRPLERHLSDVTDRIEASSLRPSALQRIDSH
jgi:hypothetical protein